MRGILGLTWGIFLKKPSTHVYQPCTSTWSITLVLMTNHSVVHVFHYKFIVNFHEFHHKLSAMFGYYVHSSYSKCINSTHGFHITFGVIIMILGERNLATWMCFGQWTQFLNFAMFHAHYCYHKPRNFGNINNLNMC